MGELGERKSHCPHARRRALYFELCYSPFAEEGRPRILTAAIGGSITSVASPPGPLAAGAEGLRRLA